LPAAQDKAFITTVEKVKKSGCNRATNPAEEPGRFCALLERRSGWPITSSPDPPKTGTPDARRAR
jgi:hypothetical protein